MNIFTRNHKMIAIMLSASIAFAGCGSGGGGGEGEGVGAESFGGEFKGDSGAGAGFHEEVDDEATLEEWDFFDPAFAFLHGEKLWGSIENHLDFGSG